MTQNSNLYKQAVDVIRSKSLGKSYESDHELTINFHPDRYTKNDVPLLTAIRNDGCIKSQFETGTSNGGLTAFKGGDRWLWEKQVFDGTYDNCAPFQRPKYGALNYGQQETGGSPRFGSSFFRLKRHLLKRSTFCYPDSFFEPEHFATHEFLGPLLELASSDDCDELDTYIEAQIHGKISLMSDVESLVLDPSYKGTEIEFQAERMPVEVFWHSGFELHIDDIAEYPEYRGQKIVDLAEEISVDGFINPMLLGNAVNELNFKAQDIKKIWHYLARFGYKSKQS
ncbi:MAG: DUF3626 domain-containing protein [Desulfobacterales bacterium]|nr:DUF3626 domain-containing protein [Desulfobacterales bacterium]